MTLRKLCFYDFSFNFVYFISHEVFYFMIKNMINLKSTKFSTIYFFLEKFKYLN